MNEEINNQQGHEANKAERLGKQIQLPSVGRQVHYFAYGTPGGEFPVGVMRAATITEVDRPGDPFSPVGLAVMNPTGLFFNQHIEFGPGRAGRWGWPVYVPPMIIEE